MAFGETRPRAREIVLGLAERGHPSEPFNPATGRGYVAPQPGDYAKAQAAGVDAVPALVETFGGVAPELLGLLREAAGLRMNRLTKAEYAETTWSARNWLTFVSQRFAVAVQRSMAEEIAKALGVCSTVDPRGAAAA